jgi:hypothetical protein
LDRLAPWRLLSWAAVTWNRRSGYPVPFAERWNAELAAKTQAGPGKSIVRVQVASMTNLVGLKIPKVSEIVI